MNLSMNAKHLLFPLLLGSITNVQANPPQASPSDSSPLSFVENKGQVTDQHYQSRKDIDFRLNGNGVNVFVANSALHYQWAKPVGTKVSGEDTLQRLATYRMDVKLLGANPDAMLVKEQRLGFHERYYTPQFGEQGGIAQAYQKVTYKNIYPQIDWVLYVKNNTVEYDFIVHPGGNVADIQLRYDGAVSLKVNTDGSLTATTPMGSITEAAPVSSQQADGKRIASSFVLKDNILRFTTSEYQGTLVIDPTLTWATYYGGALVDNMRSGSVSGDDYGNVYVGGYTQSTSNIATIGSFQDTLTANIDAFLAKFNGSGVRLWATYYGGSGSDYTYGVVCASGEKVYLGGYTNSPAGIATSGAHQTVLGTTGSGTDGYVVQFDSSGARQWATYFGGSSTEQGLALNCDKNGNAYLAGYTNSASGIATTGSHQTTLGGGQDAFLVKFSPTGTRLWSTYLGGSSTDQGLAVACDTFNNVFVGGYTQSTAGIASTGSHQSVLGGGQDGFIAKFDSTGLKQWSSYYGGVAADRIGSLTTDLNANVFVTGYTAGSTSGIASTGSHQDTIGGTAAGTADVFLVKFNSSGIRQWGTYYGGAGSEQGWGVHCDVSGNIYLTGQTNSSGNIASIGAYKDTLDVQDGFLVKFDNNGTRLWGTYFGGEAADWGYSVFCNKNSTVFLGGQTGSTAGITTTGSHQGSYAGGSADVFLATFNDCDLIAPAFVSGGDTVCRGGSYTYTVPAVSGATSYTWMLPAGWTGSSSTDTIHIVSGLLSDTIRVAANFPCGVSSYTEKVITVRPLPDISPLGTTSLCNGDSIVLTASGGTTYQWLSSGIAISGANTSSYTVHTGGLYSVVVTAFGCTDTSLSDTIVVHPLPVPVISVSGSLLSTGSYTSYQWLHNGIPITGAVASTYTISLMSGLYTVTVVDSNGCEGTSTAVDAGTLDIKETTGKPDIHIYPNPVQNVLFIQSPLPVDVHIISTGGLTSKYKNVRKIDLSNYADGIYLLRIFTDERLIGTRKIVKQHNN